MQDFPVSVSSLPKKNVAVDELTRIFNTALISTASLLEKAHSSDELHLLMESPSFRVILNAVRQLARQQGLSDRQAAEQVIQTFRKIDKTWNQYVFQEGLNRLREKPSSS